MPPPDASTRRPPVFAPMAFAPKSLPSAVTQTPPHAAHHTSPRAVPRIAPRMAPPRASVPPLLLLLLWLLACARPCAAGPFSSAPNGVCPPPPPMGAPAPHPGVAWAASCGGGGGCCGGGAPPSPAPWGSLEGDGCPGGGAPPGSAPLGALEGGGAPFPLLPVVLIVHATALRAFALRVLFAAPLLGSCARGFFRRTRFAAPSAGGGIWLRALLAYATLPGVFGQAVTPTHSPTITGPLSSGSCAYDAPSHVPAALPRGLNAIVALMGATAALAHAIFLFWGALTGVVVARPHLTSRANKVLGSGALHALLFFEVLRGVGAQVAVTTLAGNGSAMFANGVGTSASFNSPYGVAVDSSGNVIVADQANQRIRKVTLDGVVTTLAGDGFGAWAPNVGRWIDGTGSGASFNKPSGVVVDSNGNVIVGDQGNNRIRKVTSGGVVTTLAGSGSAAFADGTGTGASFSYPFGVAVDSSGNVIVAEDYNYRIRKITANSVVTTLAGDGFGSPNGGRWIDGTGTGASFNRPSGVAVDSSGNVIVADSGNNRIRKVTSGGVVTTLAGSGSAAFADGTGTGAAFFFPRGVAVDSSGNVIVADSGNNRIRKVTSGGVVTTLAGSGSGTFADGIGTGAAFSSPRGVAVDSSGNVIVADHGNNRIRKLSCPVGTYSPIGITNCLNCPPNTFSALFGATTVASCAPCGVGFNSGAGSGVCCSAGSWGAPFTSVCNPCPAGKFSDATGASASICISCSAGKYTPRSGLLACLNCAAGSWSSAAAVSSCSMCTAVRVFIFFA